MDRKMRLSKLATAMCYVKMAVTPLHDLTILSGMKKQAAPKRERRLQYYTRVEAGARKMNRLNVHPLGKMPNRVSTTQKRRRSAKSRPRQHAAEPRGAGQLHSQGGEIHAPYAQRI